MALVEVGAGWRAVVRPRLDRTLQATESLPCAHEAGR
jgi:hypothetical protein